MRDEKGFTLVEVIVAIAILSIVVLAMLRLFNLSAIVSKETYESDNFTNLLSNVEEIFKSDPKNMNREGTMFSDVTYTHIAQNEDVKTYYKYYNNSFVELQAQSDTAPTDAKYVLEAQLSKVPGSTLSEDIEIGSGGFGDYTIPDTLIEVLDIHPNHTNFDLDIEKKGKHYQVNLDNTGNENIDDDDIEDDTIDIILRVGDIYNGASYPIEVTVNNSTSLTINVWVTFEADLQGVDPYEVINIINNDGTTHYPPQEGALYSGVSGYSIYELIAIIKNEETDEILYSTKTRKYYYGEE